MGDKDVSPVDDTDERRRRTSAAREAKLRGAADYAALMRPVLEQLANRGWTHFAIAKELNKRGVKAARGGFWSAKQVDRLLARSTKEEG